MQQVSKQKAEEDGYYDDDEVDGTFGVVDWLRIGLGVVLASQVVARCVFGHWWSLPGARFLPFGAKHEATLKPAAYYWVLHGYSLPHVFSLEELARFSGTHYVEGEGERGATLPIVLAINGTVFDVTSSPRFYGPWGPYRKFTGTDCSNNFQFGMFDYQAYNTPCHWDISDLTEDQLAKVSEWRQFFEAKYPVVGTVVFPLADAQPGTAGH